jgi:uncharacterized protein YfaS (alpha-2-macroglobulin family)
MAKTFQRAETVVCSILVKTAAAVLTDPATSTKIVITGPTGASVVTSTAMTRDSVGAYHYDYQPAVDALKGIYHVKYTAVDGTRITIEDDTFVLE